MQNLRRVGDTLVVTFPQKPGDSDCPCGCGRKWNIQTDPNLQHLQEHLLDKKIENFSFDTACCFCTFKSLEKDLKDKITDQLRHAWYCVHNILSAACDQSIKKCFENEVPHGKTIDSIGYEIIAPLVS